MTELDHQMHAILLRLELLSHGSTQAFNASGGGSGEPDDKMMTVVVLRHEGFAHLIYRERYEATYSEKSRRTIVEEAGAELAAWVKREKPPTTSITEEQIVVRDFAGWTAQDAAQARKLTPKMVRDIRRKANLGTEDGRPSCRLRLIVLPGLESSASRG